MRVLMVGPFEEWVRTTKGDLEVRQVAEIAEAMEALSTFAPALMVVDRSIADQQREVLVRGAESVGCCVVAAAAGVQIPGATIQELEKHAILGALVAADNSRAYQNLRTT